ncbi:unnamed protein product [Mytilus coruscus]|uniref:DNA-directed DNA polymerase n=1 Tax=Mytilus coruscus TaxID=42192 RepID=A0A6J8C942_MYTCO|nr:unnamed protein product [Mytilus coruscus]
MHLQNHTFNLLECKTKTPPEGELLQPSNIKGLEPARQWHLYEQIRQHCYSNSAKNITCPKPLVLKKKEIDVFGKCLENIRSRLNFHLVNTPERLRKYVSKPSFERFQIFNEDQIGVVNKQVNLVLNKPIYVGQAILDLSKKLMYDFHYNLMKPMYGDKINLLFTDTDSLCYEIQTEDVYNDMRTVHSYLDTSNYPDNHFLYSTDRKKIPGFFKDENSSVPIKEFLGLRPKMYSISYNIELKEKDINGKKRFKQEEKKVAKGIAKSEIRKNLRHEHYKKCLFEEVVTFNSANMIRSRNHQLYVDTVVKKGLCSFDDKRYWRDSIESYAFGHYKIK